MDAGDRRASGRRSAEITNLTERVVESFQATDDERLRTLLGSLVVHLHDFVKDVGLTKTEWNHAVEFLTAVGQTCDAERQECVLLSDVLGVSMLVELLADDGGTGTGGAVEHGAGDAEGGSVEGGSVEGGSVEGGSVEGGSVEGGSGLVATLPTVLGPFHMTESPVRANGSAISDLRAGTPLLLEVTVSGDDGSRIPDATVDVWQCNDEGFYDVQQPGVQSPGNGRGLFTTDDEGRFDCVTIVPSHYPIPTDGPVGRLLRATKRHPWRPAHIHFLVDAAGYAELTTHIFMPGSPYLDSDAVFAVRPSLVCELAEVHDPSLAERYGLPLPFARAQVTLVLRAARHGATARG